MDPSNTVKMDSFKRIQGASLVIESKSYPIYKGINTIGRNKVAIVNIKHLNVSQNQAIIVVVDETQHFISDVNSSNGTFLHNDKLTPFKLFELSDKAEIKFGDVSGIYSKISAGNTTIHLQETFNTNEMTQNMTQNFYASNTQLIENKRDISEHSYFSSNTNISNMYNIHEEPTQVLEHCFQIPKTQDLCNGALQQVELQEIIIEEPVDDIHDAPTQVVAYKENQSKSGDSDITTSQKSETSVYNKEIHEAPTQDLNEEKDKSKSESPSTQILDEQEAENLIQRINAINEEAPISQVKKYEKLLNKLNQMGSNGSLSNKNVEIIIENSEEMKNSSPVDPNAGVSGKPQKTNVIHNSQVASTSTSYLQDESDESFLNSSKTSRQGIIEESVIENADSNESLDFLNTQNAPGKNLENTQSSTCSESDIIRKPKKPVPKLPETQLTDSPRSSICSFDIGYNPRKSVPTTKADSDSETDIDGTQEIGFKKRLAKPILSENSDCETDKDERHKGKSKIIQSDSETDCEDEILQQTDTKENNSNADTDIENNGNELDDTDCIPATQDAFAEALGYKPVKSQNTQHSSEEFKLGLTELMDDSQKKDEISNEDNQGDKTDKEENDETIINKNAVDKDELYLLLTQKIQDTSEKRFTFKKKSVTLDESLNTFLSSKKGVPSADDDNDDVFLQPTQRLDAGESNDIFLQPTQKLATNKSYQNNKQSQKMDSEGFLIPADKDDVFLQPTQSLDIAGSSLKNTQDDIYAAITQILQDHVKKADDLPITQDDIYDQATQRFQAVSVKNTHGTQNEDVYDIATQKFDCTDLQPQEIHEAVEINSNNTPDTQFEMPFDSQNTHFKNCEVSSDRPGNPIIQELDNLFHGNDNTANSSKELPISKSEVLKIPSTNANNENGVETMSQIEAFIKKPQSPPSTRKSTRKSKAQKKEDPPETLSQIDAFINKPLSISLANESKMVLKKSVPEDTSETLSQIAAFVNKPLKEPNKEAVGKNSKRIARGKTVKDDITINNEVLQEDQEYLHSLTRSYNDDDFDRRDISRELKNDADQSFALFESKISKVRKNPQNESVLGEIKVALTTHRRSMNIMENTKKVPEIAPSETRKTRRKPNYIPEKTEESTVAPKTRIPSNNTINEKHDAKVNTRNTKRKAEPANEESDNVIDRIKEVSKNSKQKNTRTASDLGGNDFVAEEASAPVKRGKKLPNVASEKKGSESSGNDFVAEETSPPVKSGRKLPDVASEKKGSESGENDFVVEEASAPVKRGRKLPNVASEKKGIESSGNDFVAEETSTPVKSGRKLPDIASEKKGSESGENDFIAEKASAPVKRGRKLPNVASEKKGIESSGNDFVAEETSTPVKSGRKLPDIASEKKGSESGENDFIAEKASAPVKRGRKLPNVASEKKGSESSGNDFVAEEASTPVKRGRKLLNVASEKKGNKRKESSSEPNEIVPKEFSTPPKRGRMTKTKKNVVSDDSGNKSRESSTSDDGTITPKKTKNAAELLLLTSAERSKRKQRPKVVFTMLDSPQLESYIRHLGGSVVDSVDSSTVLVTQSVKRSQKLLTAVAQGKPICSEEWIRSSKKNNDFLDPWDYVLQDKEAEKKWDFSLKESLIRAGQNKLMAGYIFQLLVANAVDVLKGSIEAAGGKIVSKVPAKSELENFIVVSTPDQKTRYQKIKKQHPDVRIIEPEAIFDGILRQEFRISRHILK